MTSLSPPVSNEVFVGNLSFFCREQDLLSLFQDYCCVQEARVMRSENSARSLMYGFVTLSSAYEAREMAKLLNNHLFMGRRLKVETSDRKTGQPQHSSAAQQHRSQQVHVSFSTAYNFPLIIKPTETLLLKYFTNFGGLFDVAVKEYHASPDGRQQEGYAFLTFESAVSASAVIRQGVFMLEGLELRCTAPLPPTHVRHAQTQKSPTMIQMNSHNFHRTSVHADMQREGTVSALMNTTWHPPEPSLPLSVSAGVRERESPLSQRLSPSQLSLVHGAHGTPSLIGVCSSAKTVLLRDGRVIRLNEDRNSGSNNHKNNNSLCNAYNPANNISNNYINASSCFSQSGDRFSANTSDAQLSALFPLSFSHSLSCHPLSYSSPVSERDAAETDSGASSSGHSSVRAESPGRNEFSL